MIVAQLCKIIELHTYDGWTFEYINYSSTKLFKINNFWKKKYIFPKNQIMDSKQEIQWKLDYCPPPHPSSSGRYSIIQALEMFPIAGNRGWSERAPQRTVFPYFICDLMQVAYPTFHLSIVFNSVSFLYASSEGLQIFAPVHQLCFLMAYWQEVLLSLLFCLTLVATKQKN